MPNVRRARPTLSAEELAAFCLQLAYPVAAGIPPADCIGLMLEEAGAGERALLEPAHQALLAGAALSDALAATGRFPPYMLRMLAIGQISGSLDRVLEGLAAYYSREAERSAGLRRAVAGPAVMLGVMAAVMAVLVTRVLPVFGRSFERLGLEPSPLAARLLEAGQAFRVGVAVAGMLVAAAAVAVFLLSRGRRGLAWLGRLGDRIFFRGRLALTLARARLAGALPLLVAGGLDFDQVLEQAQGLLAGGPLEAPLARCRQAMARGEPFAQALREAGIFGRVESGILAAGFRAGSLERALDELALRCRREEAETLDRFVGRVEPALVALLALLVGLTLLSVMLPLIGMLASVGV